GAVVVGEIDIRPTVLVQIRGGGGERPPRAPNAEFVGDLLELAVAQVVEHQVLAAVRGELEAVVHDPRGRQMPEVDVVAEVGRHVEIEPAVAIVIDPDCAVAVDPAVQTGGFGHVLEMVAVDVFEEREIAVAIDEHVLASVVVEVTPYAAPRNAFATT